MTLPLTPASEPRFFERLEGASDERRAPAGLTTLRWRFLFYGTCRRSAELITLPILSTGGFDAAQAVAFIRARRQLIDPRIIEHQCLNSEP
jgi:hypothetical protein